MAAPNYEADAPCGAIFRPGWTVIGTGREGPRTRSVFCDTPPPRSTARIFRSWSGVRRCLSTGQHSVFPGYDIVGCGDWPRERVAALPRHLHEHQTQLAVEGETRGTGRDKPGPAAGGGPRRECGRNQMGRGRVDDRALIPPLGRTTSRDGAARNRQGERRPPCRFMHLVWFAALACQARGADFKGR
jgi:hypothetical protein